MPEKEFRLRAIDFSVHGAGCTIYGATRDRQVPFLANIGAERTRIKHNILAEMFHNTEGEKRGS